MKKLLLLIIAVALLSCDVYKDDTPAVANYTIRYQADQPILFDLKAFTTGNANSFRIKTSPVAGDAEILASSFLKYSPDQNFSDHVLIDILDEHTNKLGEVRVNLEASESTCGIAIFDYATISNDSILSLSLADNDRICEPITSASLYVEYLENTEGLSIALPDTPGDMRISLNYHAPAGFTGTVKAVYSAYVNVKDEYKDIPVEVLHQDYSEEEYAKYKVASVVEIHVNDF